MAYAVGQLIKETIASPNQYLTSLNFSGEQFNNPEYVPISFEEEENGENKPIYVNDYMISYEGGYFSTSEVYHLSFYLDRMWVGPEGNKKTVDFHLKIQLKSGDGDVAFYQDVKRIKVEGGNEGDKALISVVFSPNDSTYNNILLRIERTQEDWEAGYAKELTVSDIKLEKVVNILPQTNIKKIGIQGTSGLMFTLNGEEMIIGRTGIYELYHPDIPINYLGFVTYSDDDFFIVDYQYEEKEASS